MSSGLYSGVSGLALGAGLYRSVSGLWSGASGLEAGFAGGSPYSGASLYLDFLSMTAPTFDSRITFSRGSNATVVDSTGRVTYAPNNTFTNSVGPFSATGVTTSTASGAAPDGTNAVRLTKTDATTPRYAQWATSMTVQSNTGYVVSAYFKFDGSNTTVSLEYNNSTNFGIAWIATFNVTASGITANAPSSCTSGVQAVGNGWFRVWAAFTSGTPSAPTNPIVLTQITGGNGVTVLVAWGQLEQVTYQTTPSTYAATAGSSYYGPRFDYDPVTLAPRGLLVEEARTNLLTYSEQFDNAAWVKASATVAANVTTSPDGTADADKLIPDAASGDGRVIQTFTGSVGATYTLSVYAKRGEFTNCRLYADDSATNTVSVSYNLSTGAVSTAVAIAGGNWTSASSTITTAGNGWWRITLTWTATAVAPTRIAYWCRDTGDGTSGIYIYGAQLEVGSFATSYIPTVASTVTRSADVATMTGTNFSSWYNQSEGTFVVDTFYSPIGGGLFGALGVSENVNNKIDIYTSGARALYINVGGINQVDLSPGGHVAYAPAKIASAYKINDFAATINARTVLTDTSGTLPVPTSLLIGRNSDNHYANGHIREIAYFNTRQSNTRLQTLTAPPLVTTLSLDFTSGTYLVGY